MFSFNLQRFARVMTVVDGKVVEFLPVATTSDRGGVVIGDGVSVDNSGKISVPESTTVKSGLISSTDKTKLNGIANGAQVNVIEKVQVNNTDLAITNKSVNIDISNKVDKVSGKTLSSNDYTTTEKNKLSGIASGAQVNVIEKISIDGVNQSINSKTATLNLDAYAKKSDIASGVRIKGSVNSFSDLPSNAVTGDLYNIKTAGGTDGEGVAIKAGDNVIRTDDGKWDVMAGAVDLSNYVKKDGSKVLSTNDYTTEEKNKLSGIASNAQVNVIETVKVNGTALTPSNKAVNIDISGKVDKVSGKQLSTNDYTTNEKNKLAGIANNANNYSLPVATASTIGGVMIDSATNSNIVLGTEGNISVPPATTTQAGVIKYGGGTTNYLRADGSWAKPPNTTYSAASTTKNGLMSSTDKTKLDGIATNAQVNIIETVKVNGTALTPSDKAVDIDISNKVDKVSGKGLSTNDYTTAEKNKLSNVASGAQVNIIETVKVNDTALAITNKAVNIDISGKVDKVSGKGLSTNDYTTNEKNKLAGIASGAQVNVIESISIDGTNQNISSKKVTLNLSDYAKKSDIASGIRIKGSVNSFSDLPTDAVTGDLYNIKTAGGTDGEGIAIRAGDNVVRTENGKWDVMAGTVDLSNYVQKDGSKVLSTNDYTTTEKNKLAGIASNAQVNVIETVKVNGTALTPSSKAVNIDISGKVDKVSGKALSTNDYTTTEKNKLANIASGAQVNVIETVKVNGTALTPSDKAVNIDISGKVDKVSGKSLSTNDYTTAEKNKLAGIDEQANKYILPVATSSTIGGVKIDSVANSNIVLGADGSLSVPPASTSQAGVVKYGGGTANYLRADGTWAKPPDTNTTYKIFSSTNATINGTLVPSIASGTTGKYLQSNGQWATPPNTTYAVASQSANGLMSASDKKTLDSVPSVYLTKTDASNTYLGKTAKAASANTADNATKATKDGSDRVIVDTYETKANAITGVAVNGKTLTFTKGDGATVTLQTQDTNTDTHWTTKMVVGASNSTINASTSSGNTYIRVFDNNTERGHANLKGTGATTITSDDKGVITVNSTNTTYSTASQSTNGLMSAADKKTLDGISSTYLTKTDASNTYETKANAITGVSANGRTLTFTKGNGSTVTLQTQDNNTTYKVANSSNITINGTLVPSVASGTTNKYLRSDGTWQVPPDTNTTYSQFSTTAAGLAPKSDGATNKYLRADGTWQVPPDNNTTYKVASSTNITINGTLIPSIASGTTNKYLRSDGTWQIPPDTNTTYKLFNSSNCTVNGTLIPSVAASTTGKYLQSNGTWAIPPNTTYSAMSGASSSAAGAAGLVPAPAKGKQTSFLRGDGTWVIPTNTTYAVMTGASSSEAGASGLVPTPAKGKQASFLRGDGTWAVPTNTTYAVATESANGLLSSADKKTINGLANTYLGKTAKAASATTADSATTATKATEDKNGADITTTYAKLAGAAFTGGITGTTATFSGTLTLTKTTDLSGTANNSPALIIGGAATKAHIEIDGNEIHAKGNDSTTAALYINNDGGTVNIGEGGVSVKGDISAAGKTITAGTFKGNLTGNVTGNVSGSSGSCTGNSATTTKFASAQTITLAGDVTGSVSSQAGWTITTKRRTCIVGQSSSTSTKPWYKVASCTLDANSRDNVATFLVQHQNSTLNGILRIRVRRDTDKMGACTATWLINNGFDEDNFVIVSPSSGYSPELWVKIASSYTRYIFTVLSENTNESIGQYWTFYPANTAGQSDSITTAGTQNTSTLLNIKNNVNTATKLATGRTLKVSLSSTAASSAFDGSANIANIGVAGILPVANGGTGANALTSITVGKANTLTNARALQVSLSSTGAPTFNGTADVKNIGVTGTLPVAHGGTGQTSIANIQAGKDGSGNVITSTYAKLAGATFTGNIKVDQQTSGANRIICANNSASLGIDWTSISGHEIPGFVVGTSTNTFAGLGIINGKNIGGSNHLLLQSNGTMVVSGGEYGLNYVRKSGTDKAFNHGGRVLGNDYLVLGSDHEIWVNTNAGNIDNSGIKTFHFGQNGNFYVPDGTIVTGEPIGIASGGTGTTTFGGCWYGTCTTAAATAEKIIEAPGFVRRTGAIIVFALNESNSASVPTFNVNSTGAKGVWKVSYDSNGVKKSTRLGTTAIKAGLHAYVVDSNGNYNAIEIPE